MSYFIIGGTNVAVGQKSGGRNVGGRNVCGTYVCRTKVAPPLLPLTEQKKTVFEQTTEEFQTTNIRKKTKPFFYFNFFGKTKLIEYLVGRTIPN